MNCPFAIPNIGIYLSVSGYLIVRDDQNCLTVHSNICN